MNSLDCRYLRLGDTFAHRFAHSGTYRYSVAAPGSPGSPGHHAAFEIVVEATKGAASQTHHLVVGYANGTFSVDRTSLNINSNDVVLWSTNAASAPGFSVVGASQNARFDSAELQAHSLYSHAFGVRGEFEWRDAHDPSIGGFVTVGAAPACHTNAHRAAYSKTLSKPALVIIDAPKAHPKRIKVVVGQTVFFVVRSGHGVTIVERALLAAGQGFVSP